jgi:hypothetical protein
MPRPCRRAAVIVDSEFASDSRTPPTRVALATSGLLAITANRLTCIRLEPRGEISPVALESSGGRVQCGTDVQL